MFKLLKAEASTQSKTSPGMHGPVRGVYGDSAKPPSWFQHQSPPSEGAQYSPCPAAAEASPSAAG